MDATEVIQRAVELVDMDREYDADALMVHAVHIGIRPCELMKACRAHAIVEFVRAEQ